MEQIKTQNLQGYEEYRNGEITRDQFASTKTQLEKEKLNLQKRIQEVENLIGDEKEILLKKNIPVDQMIEFMGFEKLTPEMLEKIAAVNIGPGMEFDTSVLTGDVAENWKTMLTEIQLKLIKEGQKFSKKLGQWDYFGEPIGDFNTEYAYRALVALAGLGANTVEVALYPKIEQDADGNTLTGEKSYILHFESYPQVLEEGFWSVTAYGDDDFLIDNPIDRYCINDRSGLQANDDGSVDVILSEDAPKDTTNWLPVGAGGFHLFMRIYTPDMDALETWMAPTITEIYPSNVN